MPEPSSNSGFAPPFVSEHSVLLANARSGIAVAIERMRPGRVWVPSYLCHTILEGVEAAGAQLEFYEIDCNLRVRSLDWVGRVRRGDIVIVIDYFGWPCDGECVARVRERGAWVLEDACQAMLSSRAGKLGDIAVFSPRKYLGVPDGGVLTSNSPEIMFDGVTLEEPPGEWWSKGVSAARMRSEFDARGEPNHWFDLYFEFDATHPVGHYSMSDRAKSLLTTSFDYSAIAARRVGNYCILGSMLARVAIYPELEPGVVPLGFPIRLKDRDRVRRALFEKGIYPPVHWDIRGVVPAEFEDSHTLASEIMTLPCDQRYDESDMERMARAVSEEMET